MIIENDFYYSRRADLVQWLKREFGELKDAVKYYLTDVYKADSPEIWQKWWTNSMVGDGDDGSDGSGPWNSPEMVKKVAMFIDETTNYGSFDIMCLRHWRY